MFVPIQSCTGLGGKPQASIRIQVRSSQNVLQGILVPRVAASQQTRGRGEHTTQ